MDLPPALALLLQMISSVVAAFLAAHLAVKRFQKERWWEAKANAYRQLAEALHEMKWPASEHIDAIERGRSLPQNESNEHWERFRAARRKAWLVADGASFVVAPGVLCAVAEMDAEISKSQGRDSIYEIAESECLAVDKCLARIKTIAKNDLRL